MARGHERPLWQARSNKCRRRWRTGVGVSAAGRGGAQTPDGSAPSILEAGAGPPTRPAVHPVAAPPVGALAPSQKSQAEIGPASATAGVAGRARAWRRPEHTRHVVGAVAVLGPGLGEPGVLEGAATRRSSRRRWAKSGAGGTARSHQHRPLASRNRSGQLARYARATTGQPSAGRQPAPPRPPCARPVPARSAPGAGPTPSHRDRRGATTMPAPLANSSTACGKAVATTGLPAAMASTSTPEVTCSVES